VHCGRGSITDVATAVATSPRYDARHSRTLALVRRDHWLVRDRLTAPSTHRYEARWHLAPGSPDDVKVERRGPDHVVTAPGVRLTVGAPGGVVEVEEGWISPTYGVKHVAPVVVVATTARDATIVTRLEAGP